MTVGEKIRAIRIERGISKWKLAKEAKINYRTLGFIEQKDATNNPNLWTLKKILDILGVSFDEFLEGVEI